jgi:hypothetical protein
MARSDLVPAGARPWLIAAMIVSASAFGWAALVLPWRPGAPIALLGWGLAVLHLCSAFTLAWRPARAGRPLRLLAIASLGAAAVFALAIALTSVQMVRMFGALGWALSVALGAIGWLALLGTLPLGLYLVSVTRRLHERA